MMDATGRALMLTRGSWYERLVLLALALATPVIAKSGEWQVHKVEIDGTRYTVRHHLTNNTAMVFIKSPKRMSAALYVEMKHAAENATGCKATDSFARGSNLDVALDCANAKSVELAGW